MEICEEGRNMMSKYVISTVEITKRIYLVEAYSQTEALDKNIERGPDSAEKVEVLGEMTYSIDAINEYEYNKDWKPKWEEYKEQWSAKDPDIGPDQLKIFDE